MLSSSAHKHLPSNAVTHLFNYYSPLKWDWLSEMMKGWQYTGDSSHLCNCLLLHKTSMIASLSLLLLSQMTPENLVQI